jgi:hypothetical protein
VRDSQRAKLYRAERAALKAFDEGEPINSIPEVRDYLEGVSRKRFFHSLWKKWRESEIGPGPARFDLADGRGTSWARGGSRGYHRDRKPCPTCGGVIKGPRVPVVFINAPRWSRRPRFLLHELAHAVCPRDVAPHGREFAAIFLALVKRYMGDEAAAALRASYRTNRVKWNRRSATKRTLTPEQRAAAIERFAIARAAKRKE